MCIVGLHANSGSADTELAAGLPYLTYPNFINVTNISSQN